MAALKMLGLQIPNYTFPGVKPEGLFDHVAMGINKDWARAGFTVGGPDRVTEQVQALLDAGLDGVIFNMPHMEIPEFIELAGTTLARQLQTAAAR